MVEDNDPFVGRTLADKYVLEAAVGQGAMGRVYRALQRPLDKVVAVKVMHAALGADALSRGRFLREAKAASRIDHPNSVQVFDFGTLDDGTLYIVMEFVRGRDLAKRLQQEGRLTEGAAAEVMAQCLSALAAAHDAGIVHRDLKPENIMLVPRPDGEPGEVVKVADFGIAKIVQGEGGEKLTTTGLVAGTPAYMSPENAQGFTVDARSDLYACGIILYELVTGRLPLLADSALAVVVKHITEMPPPPSRWAPEITSAFDAVIMRCLQKDPSARFQDARSLRAALKEAVGEAAAVPRASVMPSLGLPPRPVHETPQGPSAPAMSVAPAATQAVAVLAAPPPAAVVTPARAKGERPLAITAALVGAGALASLVAVVAFKSRATPDPTSTPVAVARVTPAVAAARPEMAPSVPAAPTVVPPAVAQPEAPQTAPQEPTAAPQSARSRRRSASAMIAEVAPAPTPAPVPAPAPTPTPAPATAPAPTPAAAVTPPSPPPTPPAPTVAPLRSVAWSLGAISVSGGLSRSSFVGSAGSAGRELARCVEQRGRGRVDFLTPMSAAVVVTVRDQRLDGARVSGLPGFAAGCDSAVRAAFDHDHPESDTSEYEVRFSVVLTPER